MKPVFIALAWIGLALTTAGPILVYAGMVDMELNKKLMLAGMVIWFLGATPWLGAKKPEPADSEVEI